MENAIIKMAFSDVMVRIKEEGLLFLIFTFCLAMIIRPEIQKVRVIRGALSLSMKALIEII